MRILLTGVRGKTGVPLAALVTARADIEVRGGSSDSSAVEQEGVVPTLFSWDDEHTWAPALDGALAVYVVRPDPPDAPELVAALAGGDHLARRTCPPKRSGHAVPARRVVPVSPADR